MALNFANNNSLSAITSLPASISGGAMTLISTQTASSSSTISFTSGIDSTYDEYVFKFYDIHPSADITFGFQVDTGTNTNYNQTITSTTFRAYHNEAGGSTSLGYASGDDQAQGTAMQPIALISTSNDDSASGTLQLFAPSSSTFVKHFIANSNGVKALSGQFTYNMFTAGYINTTTAITRVQFKTSSGNIDSGVIKLYGVS
nr:hypothetical protein [uncultured Mediterranean phage uvMED]